MPGIHPRWRRVHRAPAIMRPMTEPAFFAREGLLVEIYDASFPEEIGDVPFYEDLARRTGGPVLELGCGTGRVVWPLAEAGLHVVGLDISASASL